MVTLKRWLPAVAFTIMEIMLQGEYPVTLQAAEPEKFPAEILNLASWKLTVPYNTERKGNPDEVLQPELATFQDPTCFFVSVEDDAVIFRAACGGSGTENSSYPRSELRQMQPNGRDEIGWSTTASNLQQFDATLAITHTPDVKQHLVCAQIHSDDDDVIMIRLEKKKLFIERNDYDDVPLDSEYQLGDKFALRIVAGKGRINVWYNRVQKMDWKVSEEKCYFKAGCYTQSNVKKGDRPDAYGEVKYYRLSVSQTQR